MSTSETLNRKHVFHHRNSSQQFLFNQSDVVPNDKIPNRLADVIWTKLSNLFPELRSKGRFIDMAIRRLDSESAFTAMVIKIDLPETDYRKNAAPDSWLDLADIIDHICNDQHGMWGIPKKGAFGIFFIGDHKNKSNKIARRIRERFAEHGKETISIGIASYPTLNFKKPQIMENAVKALNHAAFFGPESSVTFDAITMNISGDRYFQKGDIHGAIKEFSTGLMLDASNVNLHNSLGVCYGVLERYYDAMDEFDAAIKIDSEEAIAIYNFGLVKRILEDQEKALDFFLRADAAGDDIVEISYEIGNLCLQQGQVSKGLKYFEKAAQLKPTAASIFRCIAECHQRLGKIKAAVFSYKKAIRLNPNDAHALSALGSIYEAEGMNLEIATLFCQQSVDIEPGNGLFHHRLGKIYLKENRFEDAISAFVEATNLGHDSARHIKQINRLQQDDAS